MLGEELISDHYDKKKRTCIWIECAWCKSLKLIPKKFKLEQNFCNNKCYYKLLRSKQPFLTCDFCQTLFQRQKAHTKNSRSGKVFCKRECKDFAQRTEGIVEIHPSHYNMGRYAYRRIAFRAYGKKCQDCGYDTNPAMLDVHHIDGNRNYNNKDNLRVLCVWCHAFKTRGVEKHSWNGVFGGGGTGVQESLAKIP